MHLQLPMNIWTTCADPSSLEFQLDNLLLIGNHHSSES